MKAAARRAAAAVALALAGCSRDAPPAAPCSLPDGATVLALGDSLTAGVGGGGQGYAEQLQELLAQPAARPGVTVVQRGISGERSAGLLARLEDALAEHRPAVVLLTTGGNDFLRGVPEAETRRHLLDALVAVRAAGAWPLVFAVPRPSLAAAVGLAADDELFAEVAAAAGAGLLPGVVAEVLSQEALKSDAIHPNRDGYARMAQAALQALEVCGR